MILTHLKFALRFFIKDKYYSLLNLLGLSLAIVSVILVMLFMESNLTYDQHFNDYDRVYRLTQKLTANGGVEFNDSRVARELGLVIADENPGIENVVRVREFDQVDITIIEGESKETYVESEVIETDSTFFNIFNADFIQGSPELFNGSQKVVITEPLAIKYFGTTNIVGKQIYPNNDIIYTIAGVIHPVPSNSHLRYGVILNGLRKRDFAYNEKGEVISEAFWNPDIFLYLKFQKNYDVNNFHAQFSSIYDKYYKSFGEQIGGNVEPLLERLDKIHFYSEKDYDLPQGNIAYVYTLGSVGFLIVILACINYMMLSTSRSGKRVSEVGIRKAMGYSKGQLTGLFIFESFLITLIALIISVFLVHLIVNGTPFSQLIGIELKFDPFGEGNIFVMLLGILVIVGLFSGIYPALYIAGFPIVESLKGCFQETKSSGLRKILFIVQLTISLVVIIAAVFMNEQLNFTQEKDLGFEKDQIMLIPIKDSVAVANTDVFLEKLETYPFVNSTASGTDHPGSGTGEFVMHAENSEGSMVQTSFKGFTTSGNYIKTMGIEIIEGRDFSDENSADYDNAFLVNEQTVRAMGWKDNPIGKKVQYFHNEEPGTVIGVFKDINYSSLHNAIGPMFIVKRDFHFGDMHVNFDPLKYPEFINTAKKIWSEMPFTYLFEYKILNQAFEKQYKEDNTQFTLIRIFSVICIFISVLGLFGVASYDASRRIQEVSIRKTLGASIISILVFFSSKYIKPVVISVLISIPLSNYLVTEWLKNFEYHIEPHWSGFLWPIISVSLLVFVIVIQQSWSTAAKSPVINLR